MQRDDQSWTAVNFSVSQEEDGIRFLALPPQRAGVCRMGAEPPNILQAVLLIFLAEYDTGHAKSPDLYIVFFVLHYNGICCFKIARRADVNPEFTQWICNYCIFMKLA